jgi:signal transduction histidine kinase/ActR/RegA family two-component response regulator
MLPWLAFLERSSSQSRLERERAKLLTQILTAGAVVSGAMFLFVPLWRDRPGIHLWGYGLTFLLHVLNLALVRNGRPLLAAKCFNVSFFSLVTVLIYVYGGIRGLGGFVYPLVVLSAGLMWSGLAALGFAVASSVAAGVLSGLEARGLLNTPLPAVSPTASWAVVTASVVMTAVMLFVALQVIRSSQEEAVESERRRRALELELARSQRMESLGKLAGGLAHDFNNMLTGIIGHAELVALKAADNEELSRHAQLIVGTGERAAQLTRQLLTFSRQRERVVEPTSVHRLVENVVAMLERSVDRRIQLKVDLAATPDVVDGDAAQLESALLNLGINGRDAMPEGGVLSFATERAALGEPPLPWIRIRVADTGSGIPEEHLDRIFDPYFTTKAAGKGTGLGLAAVYGTLRDHGGDIAVESRRGAGTTFTLSLPASGAERGPAAKPRRLLVGLPRRVLAVDDEPAVLESLRGMLESLGHTVLTASDGAEAIEMFTRDPATIDIVVLDMVLPRMSGRQVLERLRERDRRVRFILTSGYSEEPLTELLAYGGARWMPKPFRQSELAVAIEELSTPESSA